MNDKAYIHEFIDIIGHNRANYMHHMTANFSPTAQEDRQQLCYGVWGVVGSTKKWPEVVNIWEEQGSRRSGHVVGATSSTTPPARPQARQMVGQGGGVPLERGRPDSDPGPVDPDDHRAVRRRGDG